ncbi:MAG: hypothetical protein QW117_02175 [Candidatus Pacearchaeota archaeon]
MKIKGQVWIETVIYTVIMLSIIGIVLAVVKPTIQERQDKFIIENSIESLNIIESKIQELLVYGPGNTREISEIMIKKGKMRINSENDTIEFEIDSKYSYSQPGKEVKRGSINILTEQKANDYKIKLYLKYKEKNVNITYNGKEENKELTQTPIPYKIYIRNVKYEETTSKYQIDFILS